MVFCCFVFICFSHLLFYTEYHSIYNHIQQSFLKYLLGYKSGVHKGGGGGGGRGAQAPAPLIPIRFSYLGLLRMRTSILHPFSHAEQQYLMYLHYCKGVFRVGVGVDVNKTQSNR